MTMPPKIAKFIHMAQKPRRWYICANINAIKRHNLFKRASAFVLWTCRGFTLFSIL